LFDARAHRFSCTHRGGAQDVGARARSLDLAGTRARSTLAAKGSNRRAGRARWAAARPAKPLARREQQETAIGTSWSGPSATTASRGRAERGDRAGRFARLLDPDGTRAPATPATNSWNCARDLGRNHHIDAFTLWMAGGGVKPRQTIDETDEFGFSPTGDAMDIHDFHATMLRLFGLDHTRLTIKVQGRDFRLTDVSGRVVEKVIA
jgi:hypothetical protein